MIPVSPNAHRLLSDLQAGHPMPPECPPGSRAFLEAYWIEVGLSFIELWWVVDYLGECPELTRALFKVLAVAFLVLLIANISAVDFNQIVERARRQPYEKAI